MNTKSILFSFAFLTGILLQFGASAQERNLNDSIVFAPHLTVHYAYQFPGGDLAKRFGNNSAVGADFYIKNRKNYFFGGEFNFLYGTRVTEPGLLSNLMTDNGEIIDLEGKPAELLIQQRGWTATLNVGKLFPVFGPNMNSGLLLRGGVGYIQHKIRIEQQINDLPFLRDEYLKGYDRLTNGLLFNQFVGYYHMSSNRLVNFMVGFEAYQGFTAGRRDFNFDTQTVDNDPRFDLLLGLKAGWIIHFYRRQGPEFYYD